MPYSLKKIAIFSDRLICWINRISAAIACIGIFLMTWMITVNVFMRYVFNKPSELVEEYSGFLFVFIVFMGLGYVTRLDMNISVDLVYQRFPEKIMRILDFITVSVSFVVIGVYAVFATRVLMQGLRWKEASVVTLTPLWIPELFMVMGLFFFLLEILCQIVKLFVRIIRA